MLTRIPLIVAATKRRGGGPHATLISRLGSGLVGFYNSTDESGGPSSSIISSAGVVDEWRDYRGNVGFGPAITASATKRPAWDAGAKTVTFDGVDDVLVSPASALFDLSTAKSIVVVGSNAQTIASNYTAAIFNAAITRWFGHYIDTSGTKQYAGTVYNGVAQPVVFSGVATSATRRALFAGWSGSVVSIEVPNQARVTSGSIAAIGAVDGVLSLGGFTGGGYSPVVARAMLVFDRVLAPADVSFITEWAVANHAAVLA